MTGRIEFRKNLPFALRDVRIYFLSGDLLKRTTAILSLLDCGYNQDQAFRLMNAFDETLTRRSWDEMVSDALYLDQISKRPRLGNFEPLKKTE